MFLDEPGYGAEGVGVSMTSDPMFRYLNQRTAKMDRRNRLRIMSGTEIIDVAVRIYQVLGWTFLRRTIVPSLFCLAALSFFLRKVWPAFFVTSHANSQSAQIVEMLTNVGLALFVALPLLILAASYSTVVVTQLASDYMVGNAPSAESADTRARTLLPKLFWLIAREAFLCSGGFLIGVALLMLAYEIGKVTPESSAWAGVVFLIAGLAFAAALALCLVVFTRHALAPIVLTLENFPVKDAVKRSWGLLKGYGNHPSGSGSVWGLYLVLLMLWLAVWGGISLSLGMLGYPENIKGLIADLPYSSVLVEALGYLPTFLTIWTLIPVWAASCTIIYYDRRIRLEGYDIEALAEDVWRADRSRRFEL